MAINVNTVLTTLAGSPVSANSMIKPRLHFGNDILNRDEEGVYDGTFERIMTADLGFLYVSKADYQLDDSLFVGAVREFGTTFKKVMTGQEYTDLMVDGSLAEQWIISYLNGILGAGICTLVDPYTI